MESYSDLEAPLTYDSCVEVGPVWDLGQYLTWYDNH